MIRQAKPIPAKQVKLSELVNPTPRQRQFFDALRTHKYLLYGGAGGGGKSYTLRWALVALLLRWAARGIRNVQVALFCEDYPSLTDRQISKISREMPAWLGVLKTTRKDGLAFHLKPEYGGGVILLRNLDDPEKYRSAEFAAIAVDELTRNEEQVFHDLRFRLRWPGIGDDETRFLGATNPGGIGHHWVKRLWIDRDFPAELQARSHLFAYVPAKVTDNPHVSPGYVEELKSLPPSMRAAVLDGSWDVFVGQMFTEFRRDIHVVTPFAIPPWWRRWIANDPGYTDPSCWYWMAADQVGNVYVYRELTLEQTAPSEQARLVKAAMTTRKPLAGGKQQEEVEPYDYIVTGMDAFVTHKETGKSWVDYYQQGGLNNFRQPVHGAGARALQAATLHEYLRPFDHPDDLAKPEPERRKVAKLRIFDTCERLIATLPALPIDPLNREAVEECSIDHWYQACAYGLQSRHAPKTQQPVVQKYAPGTLGHLLRHAKTLEPPKPKTGSRLAAGPGGRK